MPNMTELFEFRIHQNVTIEHNRISKTFWIAIIAQYTLNLALHLIGLFALYNHKKRTNQNVIMFLLSANEVILIITGAIWQTDEQFQFLPFFWRRIVYVIKEMGIYQVLFLMYLIIIDRLVCVISPLRYNSRMTSTRLKLSALFTFLVSLATSIVQTTQNLWFKDRICSVFVGMAVLHLILASYTYIRIFLSLQNSRNKFGKGNNDTKDYKKSFLVPGVIMTNFVFFYLIPYSIYRFSHRTIQLDKNMEVDDYILMKVSRFLTVIGLGVDPVTYVLLTKHYRDIVREKGIKCVQSFVRRKYYVNRDNSIRSTTTNRSVVQIGL